MLPLKDYSETITLFYKFVFKFSLFRNLSLYRLRRTLLKSFIFRKYVPETTNVDIFRL